MKKNKKETVEVYIPDAPLQIKVGKTCKLGDQVSIDEKTGLLVPIEKGMPLFGNAFTELKEGRIIMFNPVSGRAYDPEIVIEKPK